MATDNHGEEIVFSPSFDTDLRHRILAYSRSSILWSVLFKAMFETLSLLIYLISRLFKTERVANNE